MAIPDSQSFMLTADDKEHSPAELRGRLAGEMQLAPQDLEEKLPDGTQTRYGNRVYWSTVYLANRNSAHLRQPELGISRGETE